MGQGFSGTRRASLACQADLDHTRPLERTIAHPKDAPRAGCAASVPSTSVLLKNIQTLATLSHEYGDIADAAIYVKGNVISWVGKTADLPQNLRKADIVLSLADRVVIPGLVCCHHHMYQVVKRLCPVGVTVLAAAMYRCSHSIDQGLSWKLISVHCKLLDRA